jgi:hypothetical protein
MLVAHCRGHGSHFLCTGQPLGRFIRRKHRFGFSQSLSPPPQEVVSFGDEVLAFDYSLRRGVHKTSLKFVLGSNLQQDRTQRSGGDTGRPFRHRSANTRRSSLVRMERPRPAIRYSGLQRWAMRQIALTFVGATT